MKRCASILLAASVTCAPAIGSACTPFPRPLREAGEADAQYSARARMMLDARATANALKVEASYFEEASNVYLARIVHSKKINISGLKLGRQVTLRPVQAIKGILPGRQIKIEDRVLTSCGVVGAGPATSGHVGQMAIVFDGVRNEDAAHGSQRYAFLADRAHEPRLLTALNRRKVRADKVPE